MKGFRQVRAEYWRVVGQLNALDPAAGETDEFAELNAPRRTASPAVAVVVPVLCRRRLTVFWGRRREVCLHEVSRVSRVRAYPNRRDQNLPGMQRLSGHRQPVTREGREE